MRERGRWRWWQGLALITIAFSMTLAGCTLFDDPAPVHPVPTRGPTAANLLQNGGFTDGQPPWTMVASEDGAADVTTGASHDAPGAASLRLGDGTPASTGIAGVSQRMQPNAFPEFVSGFYRVDAWQPAAAQYLQFVVTVQAGDFNDGLASHELRFVIAGLTYDPILAPETRMQFLSRAAPVIGEWTYFAYPLRQAFQAQWGRVPSRWDAIEIAFEVRYDGGPPEHPAGTAQVLYDDLYAGPQTSNPNRAPEP